MGTNCCSAKKFEFGAGYDQLPKPSKRHSMTQPHRQKRDIERMKRQIETEHIKNSYKQSEVKLIESMSDAYIKPNLMDSARDSKVGYPNFIRLTHEDDNRQSYVGKPILLLDASRDEGSRFL